jgi:myo-inositol-1(or 4)-monophosphatase
MLNFAIQTARDSGRLLAERLGRIKEIKYKSEIDLVTEADLASERLIIDRIKNHYPRHSILAEESGEMKIIGGGTSADDWKWIVDPLDGTTNYAHAYPMFCVSIALEHNGAIELGVIYDPMRDEMFTAERGRGAALNERRLQVSQINSLNHAMVCTGFPYELAGRVEAARLMAEFVIHGQAVRRDGSAALDLAYVACGRFEGFWEIGLRPWDVAAGVLMVQEAGGQVTNFKGQTFDIYQPPILATNGLVHEQMLHCLTK